MTYHGGVEDGKASAGARIMRIIRDQTLTPQDKLDEIEQYCMQIVDMNTLAWARTGIASATITHAPWCLTRAKPEAQCDCKRGKTLNDIVAENDNYA